MGISVKDALYLDIFKNSEILAGHKGLSRVVNRVSVFDCPVQLDRDQVVLKEGDFFISNFFFLKDSIDDALYALNFLNNCGCSCLCITTEHIDCFTDVLIDYCNKINFPIISIDYTVSYGDIMRSILELIVDDQRNNIIEMKVSTLLDDNTNKSECTSIVKYLNPHFNQFVTAIYAYSNSCDFNFDKNMVNYLNKNKHNVCVPFKNGLLLLISYSKMDVIKLSNLIYSFVLNLKSNISNYTIGISNNFINIKDCRTAINQALIACTTTDISNETIVYYNNLGTSSILLSFKDSCEVKDLYESIIIPIKKYDDLYDSKLLSTLISFVENDGDYKKISTQIFQHENTIRYRINKVRDILNLNDSNIEFYEKISLGVKLHKIYN